MDPIDRLREFFVDDQFARNTGCEIVTADVGAAICRLPLNEGHKNAGGFVMGGCVFTLADFAFAAAANYGAFTEHNTPKVVTQSAEIHYLRSAFCGVLTAEAKAIKVGKRIVVYSVTIFGDDGIAMAFGTFTGAAKQEH